MVRKQPDIEVIKNKGRLPYSFLYNITGVFTFAIEKHMQNTMQAAILKEIVFVLFIIAI